MDELMKKPAILTGGKDYPGFNAVIRAIVRKSLKHQWVSYWNIKWLENVSSK